MEETIHATSEKVKAVNLVYYSPTGTTEAVVRGIVEGISPEQVKTFDITLPEARNCSIQIPEDELLVIGVPVYMGRVPALIADCLGQLQARNTPAVCVVVYGNRAYDDALLELKDDVLHAGGIPIAGAAYIGEHSFANPDAPVAMGRPNSEDLLHARRFGELVRAKLHMLPSPAEAPDLIVPGKRPYGGVTDLWDVDFIAVDEDLCAQCGECALVCPTGACDPDDSSQIDQVKCITCCACIKKCPQAARSIKPGPVAEAQQRLLTRYPDPKKPEFFI